MNTYSAPEGLWALLVDGKTAIFDHSEIIAQIDKYAFDERSEDTLFQFVNGERLRNWTRSSIEVNTNVRFDLAAPWEPALRFQWRKESDRIMTLYAFLEDPVVDKPHKCLAVDIYVKPNDYRVGGGYFYHVVDLVESRTLPSL